MQTEPTQVITALANINVMGCLAVEFNEYNKASQPLMMRNFRQVVDLFSLHKVIKYMLKYRTSTLRLPHSLLVQCQSIFSTFAAIASWTDYQNIVLMELEIPLDYYADPIQLFKDLI